MDFPVQLATCCIMSVSHIPVLETNRGLWKMSLMVLAISFILSALLKAVTVSTLWNLTLVQTKSLACLRSLPRLQQLLSFPSNWEMGLHTHSKEQTKDKERKRIYNVDIIYPQRMDLTL
jgi:hypothetical protein